VGGQCQLLEKLKTHLLDLQLKRTDLLTKYEPSYRVVQEWTAKLKKPPVHWRRSSHAGTDETTDKDPNYEWARMELERLRYR